ncbi:MAG: homocysteine biosynthesis protein [Candidatus Helarchaeota archaeon]|nr:homocysteine biosynthesis protein [Candidatus Helarchaeota archaeon]
MVKKTYSEINEKIKRGDAIVVTAEEMIEIVAEKGEEAAAKEIDVVTTGTFGAMCSSGAFFNFGHADPPIKMDKVWLNDVEAYHGNAAVDVYIGATKMSETRPFKYGGGHVIEDLISGKAIELRATAYGTDCYPRKKVETIFTIDDLNQAILCNPRNGYQKYNVATNGRQETIYTYMGKLLPNYRNVTYSGAGCLNPLMNDPDYETIGIGTRIFLGGGIGYIVGEGTQHSPTNGFGTIMVKGDLKDPGVNPNYLRGASFTKYGTTLYVGFGIPIPILNEGLARKTAISDADITTSVLDYGVPSTKRPVLRTVTYAELKSGSIELNGTTIPASPLSSLKIAREIAKKLKTWIQNGEFFLIEPAERLSTTRVFTPMKVRAEATVRSFIKPAITCTLKETVNDVAKKLIDASTNHIVVVNEENKLQGIVTSWDVTRAIARGLDNLADIVTTKVYTASLDDPIDFSAREMTKHDISALPVIDSHKKVIGIITAESTLRHFDTHTEY